MAYRTNTKSVSGLGHNWLQRAQHTLARIHHDEGNDCSSGSSCQSSKLVNLLCFENILSKIVPHADPQRQGPLYIEARGYLQPAVDFFARAVRSADALGTTSGDLLAAVSLKSKHYSNTTNTWIGSRSADESRERICTTKRRAILYSSGTASPARSSHSGLYPFSISTAIS